MKVETIKEYNDRQYKKYQEAVRIYNPNKGGFPYIGFYLFFDDKGNRGMEGFVASDEHIAIWKPTKIGVIRCFNKAIKRGY